MIKVKPLIHSFITNFKTHSIYARRPSQSSNLLQFIFDKPTSSTNIIYNQTLNLKEFQADQLTLVPSSKTDKKTTIVLI